jgi:hypothetical protein
MIVGQRLVDALGGFSDGLPPLTDNRIGSEGAIVASRLEVDLNSFEGAVARFEMTRRGYVSAGRPSLCNDYCA